VTESVISAAKRIMICWMCIEYVREQTVANTRISTQLPHAQIAIEKSMPGKFKFTDDTSQQRQGTYCTSQMRKAKKSGDKLDVIA